MTATPPVANPQAGVGRFRRSLDPRWILPLALILSAALAFPFDVDLAELLYRNEAAHIGWLRDILDNVEPFGHGVGVIAICLTFLLIDRARDRRRGWMRSAVLATSALGSGMLANVGKLIIGRTRPRNFDFADGSAWETFQGLLPAITQSGAPHSFPSAHAATAVGFAVALSHYFPAGRPMFCLCAILVVGHRLNSGAHFVSDVLVGAAIGIIWGVFVTRRAQTVAERENDRQRLESTGDHAAAA